MNVEMTRENYIRLDLSNVEHKNVYPESNNTQVLTNNFGKFFANKLPTNERIEKLIKDENIIGS